MSEKVKMLFSEEEVNNRINQVAKEISDNYQGKEIHLVCVLKGGVFFMCELAKRLTIPVTMDFMALSSYGNGTESGGYITMKKELDESIEGKHVMIVEDIVDSGRTLKYLTQELERRNPASLHL